MGIFKKKESKKENSKVFEHVKNSFLNVREDLNNVVDWLHYFKQKHDEHDIRLKLIENQLTYMPKTPTEIKKIIDQYYSYEHILNNVKNLHEKVDSVLDAHRPIMRRLEEVEDSLSTVGKKHDPLHNKVKEIHTRLEAIEKKAVAANNASNYTQKTLLREKIVEKVAKNSKNYVKNIIISLIQKYGNISGLQLKEIVVDEQGLCSKSSFYRLLAEIEKEHTLNLAWKGKEKHYLSALSKPAEEE